MSTHDPEPPSPTVVPEDAPSSARIAPRNMTSLDAHSNWSAPLAALAVRVANLPDGPVNALCGASAGVASGIVTCPLDVIKTRLQAQGSFRPRKYTGPTRAVYKGLTGTARVIWREDGVRGLYRGLGPMLLGYIPTWAVYMSTYESTKEFLNSRMGQLMSQVSARASEDHRPPWHYRNTLDAFRKMYAKEGIASFYSGLTPALLGLTHVAIQFPLYEFLKMRFTGLEMGQTDKNHEEVHWFGIAAATVLSKMAATSATYPHEVLRTRLQTQQRSLPSQSHDHVSFQGGQHGLGYQTRPPGTSSSDGMINIPRYRGVVRTCAVILQEEGWRAFYNGMGTNMVRAIPAAVTTMMTFESLKIVHQKLKNEGQRIEEQD
ncbi:mitochondrial carrier domain-containing protein [Phaeosphaeria sp. MPI-PUGE-AT-0046c]|nr:mitochondrial carrier domain-containing protein [Phaeosphaeria sp. MPI-PUGE-AT-0046c]